MTTNEIFDIGVIDNISKAASFSEFTDDEISMYIRYSVEKARQEIMLTEQMKLLQLKQEQVAADIEKSRLEIDTFIKEHDKKEESNE